jgi:hypothetical protein
MESSALDLFRSEQKRKKLRRLVRDISKFFSRPLSSRGDGGKAGPFLPHKGLTMLPDGNIVFGDIRSSHDAESFYPEDEFEPYAPGEWAEMDRDCVELLRAIDESRWDDCENQMQILYGRVEDVTIGERATRRSYDQLFEKFEEALEFLQAVEFAPLWVPAAPTLLTAEQFVLVDRRIAEQLIRSPEKLFSIDPRFFEELMGSIYGDLGLQDNSN